MKVMAVDYGDARTGLAVSDASGTLVGEAWVLTGEKAARLNTAARNIADEAFLRGVDIIVIGHPKNMDGSVGLRAEKSEELAALIRKEFESRMSGDDAQGSALERKSAEIALWDERLTTVSAHKILSETGVFGRKRKKTVDAVAASLILEGYLLHLSRKQGAHDEGS